MDLDIWDLICERKNCTYLEDDFSRLKRIKHFLSKELKKNTFLELKSELQLGRNSNEWMLRGSTGFSRRRRVGGLSGPRADLPDFWLPLKCGCLSETTICAVFDDNLVLTTISLF